MTKRCGVPEWVGIVAVEHRRVERLEGQRVQLEGIGRAALTVVGGGQFAPQVIHAGRRVKELVVIAVQQVCHAGFPRADDGAPNVLNLSIRLTSSIVSHEVFALAKCCLDKG